MKRNSIITIIIVILAGSICFFAGMKYQQSKQQNIARQFFSQRKAKQKISTGRLESQPVSGKIIATDDKSITVKLQDGSSKIVIISEKTQINKTEQATREDLKVGEKVVVFGQENSDESITAQNIQINPMLRRKIQ